MLFSREDVANAINSNFEPAWEMVRPVPIVTIDFGNGRVATRTLHGNIASYACLADGVVADILPGIYTPAVYIAALNDPRALSLRLTSLDAAQRVAQLRTYHSQKAQILQLAALAARRNPAAANPQPIRIPDVGKGRIERPIERQFAEIFREAQSAGAPRPRTAAELAGWQPLVADTHRNENTRRLQIHERFATGELVRPEQIKRWLYRDVLQADIDDPTMGLGEDFFAGLER